MLRAGLRGGGDGEAVAGERELAGVGRGGDGAVRTDGEGEGGDGFVEGGEIEFAFGAVVKFDVEITEMGGLAGGEFAGEVAEAGVDMMVAGSAILKEPRTVEAYRETINAMREQLALANKGAPVPV